MTIKNPQKEFWEDSVGVARQPVTQFDQIQTAGATTIIELKSTYGLSDLRDVVSETGTGSVTNSVGSGEYRLRVQAVNDVAGLSSAERGRYIPGLEALMGLGVRIPVAPIGSQEVRWGLFNTQEGLLFGMDSDGLFVARRRGGVETKTYQSSWSKDKLDGTGPSKVLLDISDGHIASVSFTWYGYGLINYEISIVDEDGRQTRQVVHQERVRGNTSVQDPNLPINVEVRAGADSSADFSVYLSGRQYSVLGKYDPNFRVSAQEVLGKSGITTTAIPLVSVRRKSDYGGVSVKLSNIAVLSDQDMLIEVRLNPTLTGASYGAFNNIPATETALEVDTTATAVSGGQSVFKSLVAGGVGRNSFASRIDLPIVDLPQAGVYTLTARAMSTTAAASVVLGMREEW